MPLENLTRERITEGLNLLGKLAEERGVELELSIFGGSAMMLAYGSRESTKDVDAIVRPSDVARDLVKAVAERLNLHDTWLNDDVKKFVSDAGTFAPLQIQELESAARRHLKITRASASYLLAMKALACRSALPGYAGDVEDLKFLIRKMGIRSLDQIDEHITRFYPADAMSSQVREIVQNLLPAQEQGQ